MPAELIQTCGELPDGDSLLFHPLCGGIHPDLAWQSLQLFADKVLPQL
jgi:hypothetical protein